MIRSIALFAMLIIAAGTISAQQSPLNKEVTLHAPGIAVQDALQLLGEVSSMNFSYNSALIDNSRKVTISVDDEKLENVLDEILDEGIQYKVVGNHIVLLADNTVKVKAKEVERSGYAISGTIYDSSTGKVIRSATIYDVEGERASITDNEGFYSILVPSNEDFRGLTYCKEGYLDTVIIVRPADDLTLDMNLNPVAKRVSIATAPEIALEQPSFSEHRIVDAVIPSVALSHSNNLVLYNRKIGQVSFLPFPGVHTSKNGVAINRFSLNILAGYTGGVEGIEIGGFLNIDRNYVSGVQIAGFGNIVGKKTRGVQLAGFTNINIGSIYGVQVAGFNNVTNDTITGVQVAGFTNYLRGAMNGAQVSGFYNHLAKGANGFQAAGFVNYAGRDFRGAQVAGFVNVAIDSIYGAQVSGFANYQRGEMNGVQIAGFSNVARGKVKGAQVSGFANLSSGEVIGAQVAGFTNLSMGNIDGGQVAGFANYVAEADSGIQLAGFMNFATGDYTGIQVAGFLNRAGNFRGLQLGTFNFSDSSDGYSIGIFNHVKHGYRALEFSA
ncbi:STN and carboxypeptidase regulatory-like domain-containing protein, partial [Bacteroidota bacterium]